MSTRQLTIALLTIATSGLAACSDVTGPTRGSSLVASTRPSLDVTDHVCKTGGWNSSTGRCE
jgi:hypothetical protein